MVKYYLELWFRFVCTVVLLLVPFLFYNLLCFFSVISLLFSKGCWLCVNWTHYALTCSVCVCYVCCPCLRSLTCTRRSFAGWDICMWQWAKEEGNSAGSWLSSFELESSWWLWRRSLLSWKHRSLCSLNRSRFNHRGLSGGVFWVLSEVQVLSELSSLYSSVSCKIS